jgi:hypothetical protein
VCGLKLTNFFQINKKTRSKRQKKLWCTVVKAVSSDCLCRPGEKKTSNKRMDRVHHSLKLKRTQKEKRKENNTLSSIIDLAN